MVIVVVIIINIIVSDHVLCAQIRSLWKGLELECAHHAHAHMNVYDLVGRDWHEGA